MRRRALYQLQRLQPRAGQHAGTQGGDGGEALKLPGQGAYHVPRHQQILHGGGADGIGGHGTVAQSRHKDLRAGTCVGQQGAQLLGDAPDRPVEKGALPVKVGAEIHGDIAAHRPAQRLCTGIVGDADVGDGVALL